MGRSKGKVDEKSLDVLKKKLKGGKAKKKPVTPKPRGRSRSRSRTPGRTRKATPPPPPPPKKKAAAERKSTAKKPVKRLEEPTKPSTKPTRKSTARAKVVDSSIVKSPGSYKLRPRTTQHSEHEISSSTKSYDGTEGSIQVSGKNAGDSQNHGTSGWFSRCIIS